MIAQLRANSDARRIESVQDQFLSMLPVIQRQAWIAIRGRDPESRDELTQEVVANAYCAFIGLVRRNKQAVAYATPLAQFGIRQVRAGRRVGSQLNKHDLPSTYARRSHGLTIERLDQRYERSGELQQLLVEDRQAGPAEIAAALIDVAAWLGSLSKRQRRIAKTLALGNSTGAVARQFGLSAGRVSQLRGWFRQHWEQFQGGMLPRGSVA